MIRYAKNMVLVKGQVKTNFGGDENNDLKKYSGTIMVCDKEMKAERLI